MDGRGTVKAAHKPHQWAPAPQGGGLEMFVQVGRNLVLLSNAWCGRSAKQSHRLVPFPYTNRNNWLCPRREL